jgi:hypothetical protein
MGWVCKPCFEGIYSVLRYDTEETDRQYVKDVEPNRDFHLEGP